ncbi:predicted protein [Naegleria gruberi]|uniref:Predicted protein n=1 Tax=Naegleria gruberi TaxID=5762 RepID=D2VYG7_NAEGR|nr:uncharacterized protein NAEGRDRAFT_74114 [Naegleria gruberi]EFC38109.1 predicted protein [Naegleria gruberi]|eukprot:XP_002670853.1 predicted protein [Naegleria gruberi strain NEG-M]
MSSSSSSSGYVKSNNKKSILTNLRSNSLFYWFLGLILSLPYAFYHYVQIYESSWIHLTLGTRFGWGWMSSEKVWSLLHQMGEEGRYHHMMYQGVALFIVVAFVKLFWRFDKRALWVNLLFGLFVLSSLMEKIMIGVLVHRALYMETAQGEKEFNSVLDFSNEYSSTITWLNFIGKSDIWMVMMIIIDMIVKPKLMQSINRNNYQF